MWWPLNSFRIFIVRLVMKICIKLDWLAFIMSVLVEVKKVWLYYSLLSIADANDICKTIIKEFCVSIGNIVGNGFYYFGSLFTKRNIIQIYLRVCCNKDVKIITKHKWKAQNLLCLWECKLNLFSLLLLEEEQIELAISYLHSHTVLWWMDCECKNMLVNCCKIKSKWNFATSITSLQLIPNDEIALIMKDQEIAKLIKEDVKVLKLWAPRLSKVDESQWSWFLNKNVHIFLCNI